MKFFPFFAFLFFLIVSCKDAQKKVFITFDDSEGIGENDPVLLNGVRVGKVLEIDVTTDYEVLTMVQLSDSIDFPADSQFEIQRQDLFTKGIYVTLGKSTFFLKNGDTIRGFNRRDQDTQLPGSNSPKILDEVKEVLRNVNV